MNSDRYARILRDGVEFERSPSNERLSVVTKTIACVPVFDTDWHSLIQNTDLGYGPVRLKKWN